MTMLTDPETAAPDRPAGRVTWRRLLLWAGITAIVFLVVSHALGPRKTGFAAVIAGAVLLAGLFLWRFPHIMRHFRPFGRRERTVRTTRTFGSPHRSRAGFRTPGSPLRRTGQSARRGAGLGRAGGRSRSAFRSPGTSGRRRGGGSGLSRLATGKRSGAFRRSGAGASRRAGSSRRSGRGSGSARRLSPAFRRFRRGSGAVPRRRTGSGGGTRPTPRRRLTRPSTWHRPAAAPRRAGTGTPRRRFFRPRRAGTAPRGHRRRWLPRRPVARSRFTRALVASPLNARTWRGRWRNRRGMRAAGVHPRAGRGLYRVTGTPAARRNRRNRRAARRNRRGRIRAARQRVAANPYTRRVKWYAPWRAWGRGGGIRASFRRARMRRGRLTVQRPRRSPYGLPGGLAARRARASLGLAARIARRWRIRRGLYAGLGIAGRTPLRLQARHWASRGTWRGIGRRLSLRRWLRNRPPPKPLLGGRHRTGASATALHRFGRTPLGQWFIRRDRRRRERWTARQRKPAAVPVPARAPVRPARGVIPFGGPWNGARIRGGNFMDTTAMADQIRELGGREFEDPQDVHDTVSGLHELIAALQDVLHGYGQALPETGVHPAYAEAVQEAAGNMAGIADSLESVTAGGVMRGPGG